MRYVYWLGGVLRGDLGESLRMQKPVTALIAEKLPVTLELAAIAIVIALAIGIPAGIVSAVAQGHARGTTPPTSSRCGACRRRTSGSASC